MTIYNSDYQNAGVESCYLNSMPFLWTLT